ncbi:hypothetical protein [Streptomyces sp. NBC_00096]|uniref:hypothetical protein n=1 Tax=Streptomyces sp. NBC_00096 TaxID=2975650 RepID=UPI003866C236
MHLAQVCEERDERRDQHERDDLEGVVEVGERGPDHGHRHLGEHRHGADEPGHPRPGEGSGQGGGGDQEGAQVDFRRRQDVDRRDDGDQREGDRQQHRARIPEPAGAWVRR